MMRSLIFRLLAENICSVATSGSIMPPRLHEEETNETSPGVVSFDALGRREARCVIPLAGEFSTLSVEPFIVVDPAIFC